MALNVLYANNAQSNLASAITSAQTSISVTPGTGALFPAPTGTDFFRATLVDAATGLINEIIHVTANVSDTFTVVRGQEGTTAKAYLAGDIIGNLLTAADPQGMQQFFSTETVNVAGGVNVTLTSIQAQAQTIIFTGALTANIQVIFPQQSRTYTIVNNTSGAFTLEVIQSTGTGSFIPQNGIPYKVYSDAVNMNFPTVTENYAVDTGLVNAYVVTMNPAPTALVNGYTVTFQTANASTVTNPTLNVNGLGPVTIEQPGGGALIDGQITANTNTTVMYSTTGPRWELQTPAEKASPVVTSSRNAKMSIATASATGTFTADEVVVKSAIGGVSALLYNYSEAINLATTGAGGMDTGTAPVSGFVSLYAIAQPFGASPSILACNTTTSSGAVYTGANMPAGYTLSALLAIIPTNASSQFVAGFVEGNRFAYQTFPAIFTGHAAVTTPTSFSISGQVPIAARAASYISGSVATATVGTTDASLSADSIGTGAKSFNNYTGSTGVPQPGGMANMSGTSTFTDILIITAQTVYVFYMTTAAGSANNNLYCSGYNW